MDADGFGGGSGGRGRKGEGIELVGLLVPLPPTFVNTT